MVELVRSGRTPGELAREFECSASAIRNWVRQADRDEVRREDGLTTAEREELRRLRRENRQLREEREILKKLRPGSLGRPARYGRSVRAREGESGPSSGSHDVPSAGCLSQRVLRVAKPWAFESCEAREELRAARFAPSCGWRDLPGASRSSEPGVPYLPDREKTLRPPAFGSVSV